MTDDLAFVPHDPNQSVMQVEADAAYIAWCVKNYPKLLAACKKLLRWYESDRCSVYVPLYDLREAIAEAEGTHEAPKGGT